LSMGHARAIVNIENVDLQLDIFKKILREELSVRKVEQLVRDLGKKKEAPDQKEQNNPEITNLQNKLTSHFGTSIKIKADKNNKGEIKIPFVSAEELDRILELLNI
ncbi:MAG: chromosome partitioning protein ParB, partial [Marinoscillum sp.]